MPDKDHLTPETSAEECWSLDGEDYRYDTLGELLDCNELSAGDVVHVGERAPHDPADWVDAEDVIENLACRGSDVGGEWADNYPEVSKEAKAALQTLLETWAREHAQPNFYGIRNAREYVITAEDVPNE